jgi:hypothetical protein
MTQPIEAVGGDGNPAEANPATPFEDIAAEMLGEDQGEEEESQEVEAEAETPEVEDEPELSEEDVEAELPPIDPPNSLTAEEKEAFKNLPREAQEFTARRIGELEKGFQTKAQEAAQAREAARTEALQHAAQIEAQAAEQLERYAQQFTVNPPDPVLLTSDPHTYALQLQAYQHYQAQGNQAQLDAENARARQAQYIEALEQQERQQWHQKLTSDFPEFLDPASGKQGELTALAKELGYPDDLIIRATADDILALRKISELKAKADKFDSAMKRQMERVRAGKGSLPPVSKPGVRQGPDASKRAKADAAWQTAKSAKSRPAKDEALATWMESTGWL